MPATILINKENVKFYLITALKPIQMENVFNVIISWLFSMVNVLSRLDSILTAPNKMLKEIVSSAENSMILKMEIVS